MREAVPPSESWPDPLDLAAHPRAWLALLWPLAQVVLGSLSLAFLCTGYAISLGLIPIAVGLPLLSLTTRGAWWLAELEAQLTARMAGLRLEPAMPLPELRGFLLGLGELVRMPSAWTRVLGLFLTLPLGTAGLGLVTTVFCLALSVMIYALAGLLGFQMSTDGWVPLPASGSAQALWFLSGLVCIVGALYLALGWVRLHARIWRHLR